jgi:hypothetical protein
MAVIDAGISAATGGTCLGTAGVLYVADRLPWINRFTTKIKSPQVQVLLVLTAAIGLVSTPLGHLLNEATTTVDGFVESFAGKWTGFGIMFAVALAALLWLISDFMTGVQTRTLLLAAFTPTLAVMIPGQLGDRGRRPRLHRHPGRITRHVADGGLTCLVSSSSWPSPTALRPRPGERLQRGVEEAQEAHRQGLQEERPRTGAKLAAWTATGATAAGTFCRGFKQGWQREWPKAKKRAATKFGRPEPETTTDGTRAAKPDVEEPAEAAKPVPTPPPAKTPLVLIKSDDTKTSPDTTPSPPTGAPMALATIPEVTGVNTLKQAVARFASEAGVTAEEAGAIAQRAQEQLAAIEAAIEQATALEFGDDGGTLAELAALRDQYAAAFAAAQALQKAAVDNAAIAAQSSKNIHTRHSGISEAVAATGGRMASKAAYTADV